MRYRKIVSKFTSLLKAIGMLVFATIMCSVVIGVYWVAIQIAQLRN